MMKIFWAHVIEVSVNELFLGSQKASEKLKNFQLILIQFFFLVPFSLKLSWFHYLKLLN